MLNNFLSCYIKLDNNKHPWHLGKVRDKIFNFEYDEKFNKYLKGYRRSSILKILYNSYHLDKYLDEKAYLAGLGRIDEFVANENKFSEYLDSNLKI